jgi:nucleotide-binding universal stress UspA family protein
MKISHILVPYDGSDPSRRSFEFALDLAKKSNSSIITVTCILESYYEPDSGFSEEEKEKLLRSQKATATKLLSVLDLQAQEVHVQFKGSILKSTSISEAILSYAEKHTTDLIVMGSRGLGGFKKLLLGSVASGVTEHSKCPVLIVK